MAPALMPGDRLLVRRVSAEQIGVGDILVRYHPGRQIVAHRLVGRLSGGRGITKGDAVGDIDPTPIALNGSVERVDGIIRRGNLIFLSSSRCRWSNRWRALASRCGFSSARWKQRLKKALIEPGFKSASTGKYALVQILNGRYRPSTVDFSSQTWRIAVEREGIAPLLHTFEDAGGNVSDRRGQLQPIYRTTVAGNLAVIGFLEKLETTLRAEQIPVMTLKGASLLNRFYPCVGMRPMEDLDLLVFPEHRARFTRLLEYLGFEQNRWRKERFQGKLLSVDLHIHPLQTERIESRRYLMPEGIDSIWQRSAPWQTDFRWVRRPADIDNVLLLSLHLLKHYYGRLIWLEDLRRMLEGRQEAFWHSLFHRAQLMQCVKPLVYSLYLLDTLDPKTAAPGFSRRNDIPRLSSLEKGLLLLAVSDRPLPLSAPILELLAVDGWKQRFSLAFETFFPRQMVRRAEFGVIFPMQAILFIPLRLLSTGKLLLQYLSTAFRVLGRMGR
ncbi:MAG TPA: nucleotidyltransferase family protein [Desulfobacterales bacterium]